MRFRVNTNRKSATVEKKYRTLARKNRAVVRCGQPFRAGSAGSAPLVWLAFRDHPSMDNAVKLLEVIPACLPYFEVCCPSTMIYEANKSLKERGLK
jgi:hypothetical protein